MELDSLPNDTRKAIEKITELLLQIIYPQIIQIRNELALLDTDGSEITKLRDIFTLCCNQVKKCFINLLDVLRLEYSQRICLQESRQCNLERLQWCMKRLSSITNYLSTQNRSDKDDSFDDSINVTIMYFVNWIDHMTLDVLPKLANVTQRMDYKENDELYETWKNDMLECVTELHISIDELLLSAMTLCKYSLPSDQHIVKARCQVVLRETKALLGELVQGDLSSTIKASVESLKLPIMPSNANVLIDVLKDVLYVLETNTNTALLALLIHCFSPGTSPVDVLKKHFSKGSKGICKCLEQIGSDDAEDCSFVKEFDLYNERLLQIGSFALSCSSEKNRGKLSLRSGLASLEALDPHLVPALMMSPDSHHSMLLINSWRQEVQEIRDNVFLIVDPPAFSERTKQMMHLKLLELLKSNTYNNSDVCTVINIGGVVYDFFSVYNKYEPDALSEQEKLAPLLVDLGKVQGECKIVSNLLSSDGDFIYDIKTPLKKTVSNDQLLKRLKLLYTIITRINTLLQPKDNEENLFFCEEEPAINNATHTVDNFNTYINSPRKVNMSKSGFVRTRNVRSSTRNFPLAKLTKHLHNKELSFSVQLDKLFNGSETNTSDIKDGTFCLNKHLERTRESSLLYKFSPIKKRSSLRRAVLDRHSKLNSQVLLEDDLDTISSEKESLLDDATSLQITDVLNEMNDITMTFSIKKPRQNYSQPFKSVLMDTKHNKKTNKTLISNIHNRNATTSKHIWNIPGNASTVEMALEETVASCSALNITQPSHVTTLERISDLDLVESKLNSLKSQLETSL
ncbi:hypothetical protein K1T71_009779 [Dendrolimus kikuchii]|uniref:Uncharacterized protein n=1 Tax=Dendrolimus kikuchii TaxID=765133 RepID=A0ACC1CSU5_9NEOP|nr:hypothetical protein K1T71_009779 [Dendrolimus kikuchii]